MGGGRGGALSAAACRRDGSGELSQSLTEAHLLLGQSLPVPAEPRAEAGVKPLGVMGPPQSDATNGFKPPLLPEYDRDQGLLAFIPVHPDVQNAEPVTPGTAYAELRGGLPSRSVL